VFTWTEERLYYLLLDGQQRITSLSKLIRGNSVNVRDRKNDSEFLFKVIGDIARSKGSAKLSCSFSESHSNSNSNITQNP
jgi:hypothetical protein